MKAISVKEAKVLFITTVRGYLNLFPYHTSKEDYMYARGVKCGIGMCLKPDVFPDDYYDYCDAVCDKLFEGDKNV